MTTISLLAALPIGGPEVAVIFLLLLLLFGAKKLPELARGMGKSLGEFKKAKQEFEDEIKYGEVRAREEDKRLEDSSAKDRSASRKAKEEFEDEIKLADHHAHDDNKPESTTPVVSEPPGKQQYPG